MGIFQRNIILTHVFLFYCLAPTDAIPAKPAKLCAGRCHHLQYLKMCHHHCTHLCLLGLAASAPPCALPSGPSRSGSHHRALLPLPLCTSIPPMLKHRGSGSGRVSAVVKWGTLPSPHHMALPQVSPRVLIPNLLRPQDLTYHSWRDWLLTGTHMSCFTLLLGKILPKKVSPSPVHIGFCKCALRGTV